MVHNCLGCPLFPLCPPVHSSPPRPVKNVLCKVDIQTAGLPVPLYTFACERGFAGIPEGVLRKLLPKHLEDKAPLNEDHMVVELFREEYPDCTVSEAPESFFVAMFM